MLKLSIPRSHFFRFLQLRNFISTSFTYFPSQPPNSLLDSTLKLNPCSKGAVGTVYSSLNSYHLESLTLLRGQWKENLGTELPNEVWEKALDRIHSSLICLWHTVIQFKVLHRLHWSKVKLAKFTPIVDPMCDQCRQAPATLSQIK